MSSYRFARHSLLSRIITFQVNRQNPDRGLTLVDFSLMVALICVVAVIAVMANVPRTMIAVLSTIFPRA